MVKPVQKFYDDTSVALRGQNALGYALPPIIPFKDKIIAGNAELQPAKIEETFSQTGSAFFINRCLLWTDDMSEKDAFELPFDPIIGVGESNSIVKRNVSKKRYGGTVKEFWTQDDLSITISGTITFEDPADVSTAIWAIRQLCRDGRSGLNIACAGLNDSFDVYRVSVEAHNYPFTPGEQNQDLVINCVSDEVYELLINLGDV